MTVPLSMKRSYRYSVPTDRADLEILLADWPAMRAAGKLPFVVRHGMIARAPRVAATLAVFTIVGTLASPRSVFDYRTAAVVLPVLWLVGVLVFGGLQGLQLWRWQDRLYEYTISARAQETASHISDEAVEPPSPWRITFRQAPPPDFVGEELSAGPSSEHGAT